MGMKALAGKPVFDAKQPITLHVIANDIDKADRKVPIDCAVARACRRDLHAKEVRVHLGRVYVRMNEGNWLRYETPLSLRSEIIAWDRGGSMEPGTFVLKPPRRPTTGARQGGKPVHKHASRNPARKARRAAHVVTDVRGGPA